MLLHLPTWQLVSENEAVTVWQSLTPKTRILCTFFGVFAVALTPNGQWYSWAIYGGAIFTVILLSRVSFLSLFKRVIIEFCFVGIILLGTLFRPGGTLLWSWGFLQVTTVGLTILASVTIKVFLSLVLLNLLIITTSISDILQALLALNFPPLLVAIMSSMYRYIYVFKREFLAMQRAAISRNLMLNKQAYRTVIGNIIGSLFVRTYERGERIYQAMLARGYQGLPPRGKMPPYSKLDLLALFSTTGVIFLGQIVGLM